VTRPEVELEAMNAIVGALATEAGLLFSERNARIAARAAFAAYNRSRLTPQEPK
jgi:hypothetical protein